MEKLISIPIGEDQSLMLCLGSQLVGDYKTRLVEFLYKNKDMFAWTSGDMLDIEPSVIALHLNMDPKAKLVKQKRRNFTLKRNMVVVEEVENLLQASFSRKVQYLEWLANIFVVKKSNNK